MSSAAIGSIREIAPGVERFAAPETIDATGLTRPVAWRMAAGASEVRVDAATVTVDPAGGGPGRDVGQVAGAQSGVSELRLTIPGGRGRIRRVHLAGLTAADGTALRTSRDLGARRIVVAPVRGNQAPIVSVPPVRGKNALPNQLTGGSFDSGVLTLPDVEGPTIRITIVTGGGPADFVSETFSVHSATLWVAPYPGDVAVVDGTGAEQWSSAGPLTARVVVDVAAAIERNLTARLPAGPLTTETRVTAGSTGLGAVHQSTSGAVIRAGDPKSSVELRGGAASMPLGPPPLDARAPRAATADLGVTHHGIGLHPISDLLPVAVGGVGGPLVTATPVLRLLPPDALAGFEVRCLAVVGWAVGTTDLTIGIVEVQGTTAVAPIGSRPGSVDGLQPGGPPYTPQVVWVDLPAALAIGPTGATAIGISVTATRGSFRWAASPEPVVQVGVTTAPAGRRVRVGTAVVELTGPTTVVTGLALPPAEYAGAPPPITTDQFVTVNVSNLRLEYDP